LQEVKGMELDEIIGEDGLKIAFLKKYASVAEALKARGFVVREEGERFIALSPTSYAISRTQARLSPLDFLEFFKTMEVWNGFKKLEAEHEVIHVEPKRPLIMHFRVSASERRLVEFAAKQYLLDLSEYIRMCVTENAVEAFIRARKQKETGLV